MPLSVKCSGCGKQYRVEDRAAGKRLRCKECGEVFVAETPEPAQLADEEQDPFESLIAANRDDKTNAVPSTPRFPKNEDLPEPPPIAPRTGANRARAPGVREGSGRNMNESMSVGTDSVTPWLLIAFVVVDLISVIIALSQRNDASSEFHGLPVSVFWTAGGLSLGFLFLVTGPVVYLGVFITSKIFGFPLVDLPYLRGCAVAAVPPLLIGWIPLLSPPLAVTLFLALAAIPLTYFTLKFTFDLKSAAAGVAFILGGIVSSGVVPLAEKYVIKPVIISTVEAARQPAVATNSSTDSTAAPAVNAPAFQATPDLSVAAQALAEANRVKTEENLRSIGQAALRYAGTAPLGSFPSALQTLVDQSDLPAHCLNSPFQTPLRGGYFYWPGRNSGMPANVAIAYDKAELSKLKTTHVLFASGEVQSMPADQLGLTISQSNQSVADWQEDQKALEKKRLAMGSVAPIPASPDTPTATPPPVPPPVVPRNDEFVAQFNERKSPLVAAITPLPLQGDTRELLRPLSPSPWVGVVKNNGEAQDVIELWDVNSGQKKGEAGFTHEIGAQTSYAINPTGTYVARIVQFPKLSVKVWSFKENKETRTIVLNEKFGEPLLAGFLNSDKLAVRWTLAGQEGLEIWDATSGQRGKQVPIETFRRTVNNGVTSPDGRFLALTTGTGRNGKPQIQFYDILGSAGKYRWLAIAGMDAGIADSPSGMAFSPDAKKVAALFTRNGISVILCWRFSDGKLLGEYEVPAAAAGAMPSQGRGLDWVHNGAAWLVSGSTLVDSASGKSISELGAPPPTGQWATGSDAVALTYEADGKSRVVGVKLDGSKFVGPTTAP